jgi:hypothetical protein
MATRKMISDCESSAAFGATQFSMGGDSETSSSSEEDDRQSDSD